MADSDGLAKLKLVMEIDGDKAVTAGLGQVDNAIGRTESSIAVAAGRMAVDMDSVQTAGGRMAAELNRAAGVIVTGNGRMEKAFLSLQSIFGSPNLADLTQKAISYADAQTLISTKLGLVTDSEAELAAVRKFLFGISQDTHTSLSKTADLYSRISINSRNLGLAQQDLLTIIRSVNESIALSGGDAASAEAAIVQFGQALTSTVLSGDEMNRILAQEPRLAEAIAAGMGKTIDELITMSETGKLTTEAVVQALLSQSDRIDTEYGRIGTTVGQAFTTLDNAVGQYIGNTDRASGASEMLASGIVWIGQNIDNVASLVILIGGLIGTRFVASLTAAAVEGGAKTAKMAADWIKVMLAVEATTFKVGRFGEQVAVSNGAAAARTAALSGAFTALGGGIGIITTLLSLGATAWAIWGSRAAEARDQATRTTDDIIKDLDRQTQAMTRGSGFSASAAEERLAELQKEQQRLNEILAAGGIGEGAPIAQQYVTNAKNISRLTEVIKQYKAAVAAAEAGPTQLGQDQTDAITQVEQAVTAATANDLEKRKAAWDKWEADQRKILERGKVNEEQIRIEMIAVHRVAEEQKTQITADAAAKEAQQKKDALDRVESEITAKQGDELQRRLDAEDAWAERARRILEKAGLDETQIQAEMTRVYQAATTAKEKITADEAKKQADSFDALMSKINGLDVGFAGGTPSGDPLAESIGKALEAMNRLNQTYVEEKKHLAEISEARKEVAKKYAEGTDERAQAMAALSTKERQLADNSIQAQLSGYKGLFGATAQLFDEHSKARAKLNNLEQAFTTVEIALNMKKALTAAVVAVASQGSGDPYSAFARVASMIAVMAGLLAQAGISFGGGGGGSAPVAPVGSGTVLGDKTAVSESADKTYQLLEDIHASEYRELVGIHQSMRDLNANITGLVANIVRNYGSFDSSVGGSLSLHDSSYNWVADITQKLSPGGAAGQYLASIMDPTLTFFSTMLAKYGLDIGHSVGSSAVSTIAGGKKSLAAAGLLFGATTIGDLLAGGQINLSQYTTIKKSGGLLKDAKYHDDTKAVDPGIQQLFTNVFVSLGQTMQQVADGLGTDVAEELNAYTIDLGKIDLKGKTGEEINKVLSGAISAAGDQMAEDLFGPIISQYQQLGEGLLETAVRLVAEQAVVLDDLSRSGQQATGDTIALSQSLINLAGGLDNFRDAADTYYDKFFTAEEKQANLHDRLVATLGDMDMILPGTRDGYRALVSSLDLTNEADQQRYVQLLQLADAADQYYSALEDGSKKAADALKDQVGSALDVAGSAAAALKDILSSDLANSSPESLYAQRRTAFAQAQAAGRSADLPELGKALLEASRAYNASGEGYQTDFAMVTKALAEVAGMGVQSPTLAAAEKQVQLLDDIRQAIEDSNGAQLYQLTQQMLTLREIVLPLIDQLGSTSAGGLLSDTTDAQSSSSDITASGQNDETLIDRLSTAVPQSLTFQAIGNANSLLLEEIKALRQSVAEIKDHAAAGVKVNMVGFQKLLPIAERQAGAQEEVARKARLESAA